MVENEDEEREFKRLQKNAFIQAAITAFIIFIIVIALNYRDLSLLTILISIFGGCIVGCGAYFARMNQD